MPAFVSKNEPTEITAAQLTPEVAAQLFAPGPFVAEEEITESGTGNGEKTPSTTKPVNVSLIFKAKEDKAASLKIEINGVVVYEYAESAVAALKSTQTAGPFTVPPGDVYKVTYTECEKLKPVYQTL